MAALSRRFCRLLHSNTKLSQFPRTFCTTDLPSSHETSDCDEPSLGSVTESIPESSFSHSPPSSPLEPTEQQQIYDRPLENGLNVGVSQSPPSSPLEPTEQRQIFDRPLENGLDVGVYKAILVGQVGQNPLQKTLRSGRTVTMFSLGTGGIRNNRRPLENEDPRDYANRCAVQWHRVSVYPERLGKTVMKHVFPGTILYVEGNLEQKVFNDPITGLVRRVREIAIRANGRLVFVGKGGDSQPPTPSELRGTGYY